MRFEKIHLAVFSIPILLAGCGGGESTNPYDGTWQVVYPALTSASIISDTKTVICSNPPTPLNIHNSAGSGTLSATCTTTTFVISTDPVSGVVTKTPTVYPAQVTYANFSITIEPSKTNGAKDTLTAIVNGTPFTGQCMSTIACSAASSAGDTLGLTR
jgi:hypothetical protein